MKNRVKLKQLPQTAGTTFADHSLQNDLFGTDNDNTNLDKIYLSEQSCDKKATACLQYLLCKKTHKTASELTECGARLRRRWL